MKTFTLFTLFFACTCLPAQEPGKAEVVSPLGKTYYGRPADDQVRAAEKALAEMPDSPDRLIAAGRAYDAVLQFSRSIPLYTRAIRLLPDDVRAYRFRGHRYISTRRFSEAISDLQRAEELAPDSFDVLYHLGLAQYLDGRFREAAGTYGRCLNYRGGSSPGRPADWRSCSSLDDGSRVAMLNWRFAALGRAGLREQAEHLLTGVHEGMQVGENAAYLEALLYYKGERGEDALEKTNLAGSSLMALGYPIANFALINGDKEKACGLFRRLVADDGAWNAFGFIAAEAELSRPGTCR